MNHSIAIHTDLATYHAEIDNPSSTARLIVLLSADLLVDRYWLAGDEYTGDHPLPVYAQDLSSIVEAAALMGRKGGRKKSDRKTMAVRKNGALGGRPRGERHEITVD